MKLSKKDKGNSRVSIRASREMLGEKTHFCIVEEVFNVPLSETVYLLLKGNRKRS